MSEAPSVFAIIPAAGSGVRLGGSVRKAAVELHGASLATWSIRAVDAAPGLVGGALVVHESDVAAAEQWISAAGACVPWRVVVGGESRPESVAIGVSAAPADTAFVLVHDAARPLLHASDCRRVVVEAIASGAAILAHRIADTVKRVTGDGRILETLDRRELWGAETPQVCRLDWIVRGIADANECEAVGAITDEASWLERIGLPVRSVESQHANAKVTRKDDLSFAASVLSARKFLI